METSKPKFEKYVLVCENVREAGDCCSTEGEKIRARLKQMVKDRQLGLRIRVSRTGCLDVCSQGPNVLLMPDNVWFKRVTESDVEAIFRRVVDSLAQKIDSHSDGS